MRYFIKIFISIMLMSMTFNALAEQKQCAILSVNESVSDLVPKLSEKCASGDVLLFAVGMGSDIRVGLAASVCDFSKSIILNGESLACIYNGVTK